MNVEKLAQTFVDLADTLVDDFDVFDLLNILVERCSDVLGVSAAGLLFADGQDQLQVAASSSESARLLDLYQLQNEDGPCFDCYRTGRPVSAVLSEATGRWPNFTRAATGEGFASVLALPLRLRDRVIGALNLFDTSAATFSDPTTNSVGQAMADVATIAILQGRLSEKRDLLNEQLQVALTSRVTIEQAKGVLSASLNIEMEEAFALLRKRSRDERRPLIGVAEEVVQARPADLLATYRDRPPPASSLTDRE
ncbi:MAG TPA: GAF and ANTAR domain-containing protein [Nocardioides sp.]|nr:GAF and ANTAR domain-containing protein [Nocardioides sp.]